MIKTKTIGAFEAKTHLSELLDLVEAGAVIHITRHGHRIADLRPSPREVRPRFGSARGTNFELGPTFDEPLDDFKDYRCTAAILDRLVVPIAWRSGCWS